jgi:hypothetical protein
MENIHLSGTDRAPEVNFDFTANVYSLGGMSYIEDVTTFFGPLTKSLFSHLGSLNGTEISFTFELIYFNSSTARVLLRIMDTLDEAAENNTVSITWCYQEDDDHMEEMGEEFGEDLEHAALTMKPVEPID